MTKAEEIIYNKLRYVLITDDDLNLTDLNRLAHIAVEEIREEFKKAGIDPWKEVKYEDPEEALHDQLEHPEG